MKNTYKILVLIGVIIGLLSFLGNAFSLPFVPYGQYCAAFLAVYILVVTIVFLIRVDKE